MYVCESCKKEFVSPRVSYNVENEVSCCFLLMLHAIAIFILCLLLGPLGVLAWFLLLIVIRLIRMSRGVVKTCPHCGSTDYHLK